MQHADGTAYAADAEVAVLSLAAHRTRCRLQAQRDCNECCSSPSVFVFMLRWISVYAAQAYTTPDSIVTYLTHAQIA